MKYIYNTIYYVLYIHTYTSKHIFIYMVYI